MLQAAAHFVLRSYLKYEKFRLIIVVLLIVGALGYLYYDTSNETVEDVLTQDAAVGSLSAPERIIDSFTQDNVIMCVLCAWSRVGVY